jgi:hypothetical protein
MNLTYTKAALALGWVLVIVAAAGSVTSALGWTIVATVALLPPVVVLRMWNEAPQSTSDSIRNVLR